MQFAAEPVLTVQTMEETRELTNNDDVWLQLWAAKTSHRVRSEWLIELIRELVAASEAEKAEKRTGMPVETVGHITQVGPTMTAPGVQTVTLDLMANRVGNAEVKAEARKRLGLPPLSDEQNARQQDHLSTMIYAAQRYRDHDDLLAKGFFPLTRTYVAQCRKGFQLESDSGQRYNVRDVGGHRYAVKHGSRKMTLMWGSPVRERQIFKGE